MFVEFVVRGFSHFDSIINEIIENFGDMLNSYKVYFSSDTLRVEHLIEDLYKDLRVEILSSKERSHEVYKIDKTDKKILSALSKNSAKSYLGLAEELSLSFDIVRYRMRNLINNGVIIKFFPEIDLSKLGYTEYVYTLKLRNASKDRVREIKKFISENQNVTYAFNDASDFNIVFVCAFNNAEGIDKLSRGLRKSFSNIIDKQEYFIIKEQILFNLFPEGLSE
jgi:DNA-binding Lrp family transcriptional regulator